MTGYNCRLWLWDIPSSVSCSLKTSGKASTMRRCTLFASSEFSLKSTVQYRSRLLVCKFTIFEPSLSFMLMTRGLL